MSIDADPTTERQTSASALPSLDELLLPIEQMAQYDLRPARSSLWAPMGIAVLVVIALVMGFMVVVTRSDRSELAGRVDTLSTDAADLQREVDELRAQLDEANLVNEMNNARVAQFEDEKLALEAGPAPTPPVPDGPAPGEMQVVLTFDDGPHPAHTRQVMDILELNGVRGVFFALGSQVEAHPEIAKEIVDRGHVLASHSWRHADLKTLTDDQIREDLARTNDAFVRATGKPPACLRAPYGSADDRVKAVAASLGLATVRWNVETLDYQKPDSAAIVGRAMAQVGGLGGGGANVLMHDGGGDRAQTVGALPQLINDIRASGRQLVTICG